jgi:hypothetical protein
MTPIKHWGIAAYNFCNNPRIAKFDTGAESFGSTLLDAINSARDIFFLQIHPPD